MSNVEKKVTFTALMKGFDKAVKEIGDLQAQYEGLAQRSKKADDGLQDFTKGSQKAENTVKGLKDQVKKLGNQTGETAKKTDTASKSTQNLTKSVDGASASLPRLRYALYDVSTTLAVAGAAMLGLGVATAGVSIKMERQFADVLRTTESYMDSTGQAGRRLRDDFNDLFTSLPVSWDALTEIGTLAGQLGVAQQDVAEFTELVAKFGATSDVSVEQAATAFGRLSELLDVPAAKYENLGSSILSVGIASVATEGQIINTTTQLAAIGNFAGLSASEVVGLSSALASLGTQPELSRGSMTRLFTKISEAVSEGGEKLAQFASLSKMSASQFASAWNNEPIKAIEAFLAGVGDQGENAVSALKELGITSVRDIPTLLRLGQNIELVSEQIAIAGQGFQDGTALQDQYGVIAETVSSKLEVMKNSVTNLISTLGEGANAIGPIIDLITGIINAIDRLLNLHPAIQVISGIVLGFTALAGVIALTAGAAARGMASMAALVTALREMNVATISGAPGRRALVAELSGMGAAGQVAATGIRAASTALKTAGWAGLLIAASSAVMFLIDKLGESRRQVESLAEAIARDTEAGGGLEVATEHLVDYDRLAENVQLSQEAWNKVLSGSSTYAEEYALAMGVAETAVKNFKAEIGEETVDEITAMFKDNKFIREAFEKGLFSEGALFEGFDFTVLTEKMSVEGEESALAYINSFVDYATLEARRFELEDLLLDSNMSDASQEQMDAWNKELSALLDVLGFLDAANRQTGQAMGILQDALGESAYAALFAGEEVEKLGDLTGGAGDEFEDLGSGADIATAALKEFMEMAFGAANAEIAMNQAMSNLGASLYENGNAFDTFSQGGQANLQALQAAFQAAGEQAVQDGYSYEVGINTVAQAMVQAGVISVQQLQGLGVEATNFGNNLLTIAEATSQAVAALQNQQAALQSSGQVGRGVSTVGDYLSQSIVNLNNGGERAERTLKAMGIQFDRLKPPASAVNALVDQLGQGWDRADQKARKAGGSGSKAARDTGKAAKDAAKEVRTLSDYVSDLGSVMGAAFDFRFGFQDSKDSTLSAFRDIQKSFEDARIRARDLRLEIRDLKAEMQQGRADISVLSYQLTVAQEYGDTLREEQIRAELATATANLAKQNADLTDKQKDLNKAVKDGTPDVTSNTEAAIAQRGAVTGLIEQYQKQIEQYAATGASQKEVENYSKQLTRQFEAQMRQLGYNREEARKYGQGLKDFTEVVKAVPRDLTVKVSTSTSAAEKAIREFTAKKRSASVGVSTPSASTMKKAGQTAAKNFKSGLSSPKINVGVNFHENEMRRLGRFYKYTALAAQYNSAYRKSGSQMALNNAKHYADLLRTGRYYTGGFTGRGHKYEEAGVVHRGEYVVKKELVDQRTGLPKADAFGQLVAGAPTPASSYANGGYVGGLADGGMVELGPASLRYIANSLNFQVDIDGKKVTAVVNENNKRNSVVGRN